MARVTEAEVREIIDVDASLDLTPFITAANLLVTKVITDSSMTDEHLKEIERWLSAHFTAIRDQRSATEQAGAGGATAQISYQYKLGLNLQVTLYGQQALLLDTSGALAGLNDNKGKSAFGMVGNDLSKKLGGSY